jgi:glycosyltransferase involved in cell wall biosynthesis
MKVLISAYACEPGKGSEPGAGWNWAVAAARRHDVCVLTRTNNRELIEAEVSRGRLPPLRFVYLDLPSWARFWKRRGRGIRLYYVLWQLAASRGVRRLCRSERFDVVHHLTFANMWLPALAAGAGAPFVLGPIAGGQRVPRSLYPALGPRGVLMELLLGLRALGRFNPLVRVGWSRAALILANNDETASALPRRYRAKVAIRPNACADPLVVPRGVRRRTAICAGRLHRFKGLALAIEALPLAPGWRLEVIGRGDDLGRLTKIAEGAGVADRVHFLGPRSQDELWTRFAAADALVLPSLKEGASFVAVEARAVGLPVVALNANGPAALAARDPGGFELVRPASVGAVVEGIAAALQRIERAPAQKPSDAFSLDEVERDVDAAYRHAISAPDATPTEAFA